MKPYIKTKDMLNGYDDLRNRAFVWAKVPTIVYDECGLIINLNYLRNYLRNYKQDQILEFESEKDKLAFILKFS